MLLQEKGGNDRSIHCSPLHLLDGSWMPQRRIADGSDFLLQRFFVQLLVISEILSIIEEKIFES